MWAKPTSVRSGGDVTLVPAKRIWQRRHPDAGGGGGACCPCDPRMQPAWWPSSRSLRVAMICFTYVGPGPFSDPSAVSFR